MRYATFVCLLFFIELWACGRSGPTNKVAIASIALQSPTSATASKQPPSSLQIASPDGQWCVTRYASGQLLLTSCTPTSNQLWSMQNNKWQQETSSLALQITNGTTQGIALLDSVSAPAIDAWWFISGTLVATSSVSPKTYYCVYTKSYNLQSSLLAEVCDITALKTAYWKLFRQPQANAPSQQTGFNIATSDGSYCLDGSNSNAQLKVCNSNSTQLWQVIFSSNSSSQLITQGDLCLGVATAAVTKTSTSLPLQLQTCSSILPADWQIRGNTLAIRLPGSLSVMANTLWALRYNTTTQVVDLIPYPAANTTAGTVSAESDLLWQIGYTALSD